MPLAETDIVAAPDKWPVAIFSSREGPALLERTLRATVEACEGHRAVIDLLMNGGNAPLAEAMARRCDRLAGDDALLRIWHSPAPDKATTWNRYIHSIWPGGSISFFIDGDAQVAPDALGAMQRALDTAPEAWIASAVPSKGRSARAMREAIIRERGIHGNLFALRGAAVDSLRATDFHLPTGIYRTDPTLAAAIKFHLDPAHNDWTPEAIVPVPDATWSYEALSWWKPADLKAHFLRMVRQAQGEYESAAVRDHLAIRKQPAGTLPRDSKELVLTWVAAHPDEAAALARRNRLCGTALRRLSERGPIPALDLPPRLVRQAVLSRPH
jgi:hypothetical protein